LNTFSFVAFFAKKSNQKNFRCVKPVSMAPEQQSGNKTRKPFTEAGYYSLGDPLSKVGVTVSCTEVKP